MNGLVSGPQGYIGQAAHEAEEETGPAEVGRGRRPGQGEQEARRAKGDQAECADGMTLQTSQARAERRSQADEHHGVTQSGRARVQLRPQNVGDDSPRTSRDQSHETRQSEQRAASLAVQKHAPAIAEEPRNRFHCRLGSAHIGGEADRNRGEKAQQIEQSRGRQRRGDASP